MYALRGRNDKTKKPKKKPFSYAPEGQTKFFAFRVVKVILFIIKVVIGQKHKAVIIF